MSIETPERTTTPTRLGLNLDKSTWTRMRFGEVIQNVTERVDDPSAAGVERYVGLEHLDPGVMTVQRWDSPDKVAAQKLRFQPGDVIFGRRRAYQKKVATAEFEGICSAHALVLRAKSEAVHPDFLPVFLSSDYFLERAISISVGSLSPTVNWRDLKVQEFTLPPLDEQKRLADLLWSLEHHRATNERTSTAIGHSVTAALREHFRMVKGETQTIDSLCEYVIGGVWGTTEGTNEVDVLALGPSVYTDGAKFVDPREAPVRSITLKQAKKRVLQKDDIVLERSGGSADQLVGRVVIAGENLPHSIPTDFQRLLRPDPKLIDPSYLYWKLEHDWRIREPSRYSKRTTNITNLTVKDYLAREMRVPDRSEQDELLEQVRQFEIAENSSRRETEDLLCVRTALLAELFEGAE